MSPDYDIAALIPHAGTMILLEEVLSCDQEGILCRTTSHRSPDNPLRRDGHLSSAVAAEYGAQAAALHGALNGGPVSRGYLAALRDVVANVSRLDDIGRDLYVSAQCVLAEPSALVYTFRLGRGIEPGRPILISGRFTIKILGDVEP